MYVFRDRNGNPIDPPEGFDFEAGPNSFLKEYLIGASKLFNLSAWAIRQKSTGYFLPSRKGRGFSFDEPTKDCFPRLFPSKLSATRALTAWLQGQWKNEWHTKGGSPWSMEPPDEYLAATPEKVEGRNRDDMEIVEFTLMEVVK